MFVRSFSFEGETRGRQKRGLFVPPVVRRMCKSLPENRGFLMH